MGRRREEREELEMLPEELLTGAMAEAMAGYDQDADLAVGGGRMPKRQGHRVDLDRRTGQDFNMNGQIVLTPAQIDYIWDKFTKDHGHRDAQGNVVWTERLQEEVGIEAGLKPLFARSRHGDARSAEVIMRLCLARPLPPVEQRVAVMDKEQVSSRLQVLTAALQEAGLSIDQIEAAALRALPTGEKTK